MADQEFLASFGVDIDESGVNRLQNILSENTTLSKDLASAFSSAYSGLQSLAAEASDSGSSFSGFQAAQQQAVSVAEEAASAIISLSAAYQGLTGSLPSGTLDLSLGVDGEDRNGTDRDSETNASLLSTIANAVTGMAAADDDGGSSGADTGSGSDVNASLELDFSKADAQIASFLSSAESQFRLSADASGIVSDAVNALDTIQNTYGRTKLSLEVDSSEGDEEGKTGNGSAGGNEADSGAASGSGAESGSQSGSGSGTGTGNNAGSVFNTGSDAVSGYGDSADSGSSSGTDSGQNSGANTAARRSSTGGRFTAPTMVEVAEDGGKEYIIPVDKESIAIPLLRQMMSELSAEARQALTGNGQDADDTELSLDELRSMTGIRRAPDSTALSANELQTITRDAQSTNGTELSTEALQTPTGNGQSMGSADLSPDIWQSLMGKAQVPDVEELSPETQQTQPLTSMAPELSVEIPDLSGFLNSIANQVSHEAPEQRSSSESPMDTLPDLEHLISENAALISDTIDSDLSANSDWSGLLAALQETVSSAPPATGVTVNQTTNNVQAPVNISVTASGSDTEALGRAVYDSAERYLVRTLERVYE